MAEAYSTQNPPPFPVVHGVRFALIPGWPGYAASADGQVWSCRHRGSHNRVYPWRKRLAHLTRGYYRVILYGNQGRQLKACHRLVTVAFLGDPPEGMEVNHKNAVRIDNRLENLEYVTRKQNMLYALPAMIRAATIRAMVAKIPRKARLAMSDQAWRAQAVIRNWKVPLR